MLKLLTPPVFDDEDKTLVAHHLFIIVWTFMAVGWLAMFIAVIIPETVYRWLVVVGVMESAGLILLAFNKYGHTRLVSTLLILVTWAAATGMALTGGGISSEATALYFIVVFIAGLVLSGKAGIITAGLCSLTGLFLVYLEYSNALPVNQVPHTPLTRWITQTIYMAIIISLQYLVSRAIRNALKRSREELKERKRVEEELRRNHDVTERLAEEMAIIANIGRVVGSTLKLSQVYERVDAEVRKMLPYDRLVVNQKTSDGRFMVAYASGMDNLGRRVGDLHPVPGSVTGVVMDTRTGLLIQPTDAEEIKDLYPNLYETFKIGLRSTMSVPLISMDEAIGSMNFRSGKLKAYTEQDLRLAEKIGMQIAGAIANAQLYAGIKKTEQGLRDSEQRYRELSIIDDLTQLYNSRHFYFQLKIEIDRSNRYRLPLTLLLLDLDNFKAFNDAYGHVEGDQVLMRLGQVVKRCLRETDFAYRYGGEEFAILLPMTTSANGAVTAERIRTEFKKECFTPAPGQDVHMTVSIGLAQYTPEEEMKAFVHRVDQLMYQGKETGKDRVCCEGATIAYP